MSRAKAVHKILRNRRKRGIVDLGKCCHIASRLTINPQLKAGLEEAARRLAGMEYATKTELAGE